MNPAWQPLARALAGGPAAAWGEPLARLASEALANSRHGDLPRWLEALAALPASGPLYDPGQAAPRLGAPVSDQRDLCRTLQTLHPWRKGPLELGGARIDTEWRSDWKWERVAPYVDLAGHHVLDIGCGNGYFGWRMLAAGARCVVGIDPTLVFVMQWLAQKHFAPQASNFVLPLADTDLPAGLSGFDSVFSMGVLYHRRQPRAHLHDLLGWLRPGGQLVLETLVIDQPGDALLAPAGRYARMPNVHFIPSPARLLAELRASGFRQARVVDITATSTDEQRSTEWMRFESLAQCLDAANPALTVEGHPAPVRAVVLAANPAA